MTNKKIDTQTDVSSAELTANYRCAFPELSGDKLSLLLSSEAGRLLAETFVAKYNYPLARRKISVCAGYFLQEATRLIQTGLYDSVISFASGFSLLSYLIAEKNPQFSGVFFDTDLPYMVGQRNERLAAIAETHTNPTILRKLQSMAFDIEEAYRENRALEKTFPTCKRPIFILDGVSYFLSPACVEWLLKQMGSYDCSAVTLYYWPEDMLKRSALFARVFKDLNKGMIKEELKSFWDANTLTTLQQYFPIVSDFALESVEAKMVNDLSECQLLDANAFFPVRLVTGERG
ncbi:MAG: hypothetical protein K0R24_2295 [Gammaproteobacteria bacterium]|jgi:O-methyltransferase involved in polyketide biosynthesis|nr:hypothetical protein [Gammaproteobacteria bacterium]